MKLGLYAYLAWFVVLLVALAVAGIHWVRRQSQGLGSSLAAILGAVLSWGLVSATIGVCEMKDYAGTTAFAVSLLIGFAGLILLAWSCTRLKKNL